MSSTALAAALFALVASAAGAAVTTDAAASLASQYSLATSTSFAFPTATLAPNDTQDLVQKQWSLAYNAVEQGGADLAFVPDPFPSAPSYSSSSNTSAPVLQVTYPAHSYSHQTGGAQFVNLWDAGANGRLQSAVLTYELAFDPGFDWVMGGKLPGIRGGPEIDNCSGGRPSNGSNCWSARVMWRTNGAGEIYSYTPTPNAFCSQPGVDCNDDDYGTSIQRGKVSFVAGQWQKLTLFVQLNEANTANGYMALYYNDVLAIAQPNMQIRSNDTLGIAGLYFSTFFGGSNSSWSTPNLTHTYFRNIQLYGGTGASTLKGSKVSAATPRVRVHWLAAAAIFGVLALC